MSDPARMEEPFESESTAAFDDSSPSKSQRKRDMLALQELGESLLALQPSQWKKLPLSDELRDALAFGQTIAASKHGALRRQRQFVGKLMRQEDSQLIRTALNELLKPTPVADESGILAPKPKNWVRDLILDPEGVMAELLTSCPAMDRQSLHTCIRNIKRADSEAKRQQAEHRLSRLLQQHGVT